MERSQRDTWPYEFVTDLELHLLRCGLELNLTAQGEDIALASHAKLQVKRMLAEIGIEGSARDAERSQAAVRAGVKTEPKP